MKKRMTNIEFVTDLMQYSKYGVMAQLFVIEALHCYSDTVANAAPEQLKELGEFINPQAWQGVAREIAEKIENRHKQK
ncbi:hypothetical protein CUZ56_00217 [Saezia sanguinis]|uniref:Uncharacterized protein n=1 Tax=Saezia sanguinis TaxID=1965230 RepID=A0A433SGA1_9BURK|nr:hypothetical protein [Saezia sanguinis]RUS67740.1 hypothetical protein CUZ56_00217 [Saezia sanguinis]